MTSLFCMACDGRAFILPFLLPAPCVRGRGRGGGPPSNEVRRFAGSARFARDEDGSPCAAPLILSVAKDPIKPTEHIWNNTPSVAQERRDSSPSEGEPRGARTESMPPPWGGGRGATTAVRIRPARFFGLSPVLSSFSRSQNDAGLGPVLSKNPSVTCGDSSPERGAEGAGLRFLE